MRPVLVVLALVTLVGHLPAGESSSADASNSAAAKQAIAADIRTLDDVMWSAASDIWDFAEPGYQEVRSSQRLIDWLSAEGFEIREGIAGMPTAFIAQYGAGEPVIAILGEYDALPGLSQVAQPYRSARVDTDSDYGHGCGHHLFGVGSAAAAIGVARRIAAGDIQGTIRFYGCPAEEGGAAKTFMARDGYFDDCDAALHWHPDDENAGGERGAIARIAAKFRFHGRAAHAAASPEQGRSALDAVELTNHAVQLMREHVPDPTRIHHVITAGGSAPNVVPAFAEVYYYVRHPDSQVVREIYQRVEKCARAGALATETELEVDYQGGTVEMLANGVLAEIATANLIEQNDQHIDDGELPFVTRIRDSLPRPLPLESVGEVKRGSEPVGRGSTDVSDVSWCVPTAGVGVACWVPGTPGHSWQAVACGTHPLARRGMNVAARTLATTAFDLFADPSRLAAARAELDRRLGERKYEPLIGPDQKPPLDYRD